MRIVLALVLSLGCLSLGACSSNARSLRLLEQERLSFRAENEKIRSDDLAARIEKEAERARALSDRLLELQNQRDELYARYDGLRAELAKLQTDQRDAVVARGKLAAALKTTQAESTKLDAELKAEREKVKKLRAELEKAMREQVKLTAKKTGEKSPG